MDYFGDLLIFATIILVIAYALWDELFPNY